MCRLRHLSARPTVALEICRPKRRCFPLRRGEEFLGFRRVDVEGVGDNLAAGLRAHQREGGAELGEREGVELVERASDDAEEDRAAGEQAACALGGVAEGLAGLGDGVDPLLESPGDAEVPDGCGDDEEVGAKEGVEEEVEGGEVLFVVVGDGAVVGGVVGDGAAAREVEGVSLREDVEFGEGEVGAGVAQAFEKGVGEAARAGAARLASGLRCGRAGDDEVDEQGGGLSGEDRSGTIRSSRWTSSFDWA